MKKYFGTDGIRGKVGEFPVTPEFVLKLGWALGSILKKHNPNKSTIEVVVGKDTRISGYMFESALEAGLSAAGVNTLLLGPMPTPAIAYLTRTFHAQAGIVISASHNSYYDNGFKFFDSQGKKLPDEWELEIEQQLEQPMQIVESAQLGKAKRIDDAEGRYIEFCKSSIAHDLDLSGLNVVVDCANGATYRTAPLVFKELGASVSVIANQPDGFNINEQCGSTSPQLLQQTVLSKKADLGIALDGDGDRVLMVDADGNILDGDQLVFIIAMYSKPKGVVGTVMSNLGMEQALQKANIEFVRTPVGDRYIIAEMLQRGWTLGGESSGHIICGNVTSTGDGIIAALQVLAVMRQTQKSLSELASQMQKFPQVIINVRADNEIDIHSQAIQAEVTKVEQQLAGKGRVLLRKSGTEPVIRVMVEGEQKDLVQCTAEQLANAIENGKK